MFKNNQILYMRFQCTDVYGCPKLLDMECVNVYASHTHADTHTHVCIQHVGCECVCVCVPVYVNAKFVLCSASSVRHSVFK